MTTKFKTKKSNFLFSQAMSILSVLENAGHTAVIIGGCVRDMFLNREPKDFDVATSATPDEVEDLFEVTIPVGKQFGVVVVIIDGEEFEVATFRRESDCDGRRPGKVEFADLQSDVSRRDFTINTMAMDSKGNVIDLLNGQEDIRNKVLRFVGDAGERIREDKLRMLRFVRFQSRFGFSAEDSAFQAVKKHASEISVVSSERIFDEMTKIITGDNASQGMQILKDTGLLKQILPEVECLDTVEQSPDHHPEGNVWNHTLKVMDMASVRSPVIMWSIVLHDTGKASTGEIQADGRITFHGHDKVSADIARSVLTRLKVSSQIKNQVIALIEKHMWITQVDRMKKSTLVREFNRDNGDFLRDLVVVHKADAMGSSGNISGAMILEDFIQNQTSAVQSGVKQVFVNGDDLIKMGFKPGKGFGDILKKVNDMFIDGEVTDISQIDFDVFRHTEKAEK